MSDSLVEQIKQLIVAELNLPGRSAGDIDDQMPLFGEGSLGLDSLDALQIATAIEERYGVRIPEGKEAIAIFRCAASLAAYVGEHRAGSPVAPG